MVWEWKPCHYATMVEIVQPFTQQPIAKSYIYKVFENLQLLWVGIWLPTHTITTTDISPDLGELAEIQVDVSVETTQLRYGWGCRTFQTASYIHVIHTSCLWTPSTAVDGYMDAHSHCYHHKHFPRFESVGWNPRWCKWRNHALHHGWGCRTFQTVPHIQVIHF